MASEARVFFVESFRNRYFIGIVIFAVAVTGISASSVYFLSEFLEALTLSGRYQPWYLIAFIACISFGFIPDIFVGRFFKQWSLSIRKKYIDFVCHRNFGRTDLWNEEEKDSRHTHFCKESPLVLEQSAGFILSIIILTLGLLFNSLGVMLVVDYRFAYAYIVMFILAGMLVAKSLNKVRKKAEESQDARVRVDSALMRSWDNIILGNLYSFSLWNNDFTRKFSLLRQKEVNQETYRSLISNGTGLLARLPVFALIIYLCHRRQTDIGALAILAATIPKQLAIMDTFANIVDHLTQGSELLAKLKGCFGVLRANDKELYLTAGRINWHGLSFAHNKKEIILSSIADLEALTNGFSEGYYTIRGSNGSGKTTLLLQLKKRLADRAFLLPFRHQLNFAVDTRSVSAGEQCKLAMGELFTNLRADVLLLDEWDQNMDEANKRLAEQQIEKHSREYCIIDVRHGRNDGMGYKKLYP